MKLQLLDMAKIKMIVGWKIMMQVSFYSFVTDFTVFQELMQPSKGIVRWLLFLILLLFSRAHPIFKGNSEMVTCQSLQVGVLCLGYIFVLFKVSRLNRLHSFLP